MCGLIKRNKIRNGKGKGNKNFNLCYLMKTACCAALVTVNLAYHVPFMR